MTKIVRYYDESKQGNPNNPASIPGVPLSDIDQATFDALPKHLQKDIDVSSLYRKTKPPNRVSTEDTDQPKEDEPADVPVEDAAPEVLVEKESE